MFRKKGKPSQALNVNLPSTDLYTEIHHRGLIMLERKVVEYYYNKEIECAYCYRTEKDNLFCYTEGGKELKIHRDKALTIEDAPFPHSDDRNTLSRSLKELSLRRERIGQEIEIRDLWEVCAVEIRNFSLTELCSLYFDRTFGPDERSGMYRRINAERIYFKRVKDDYIPHDEEYVSNLLLQRQKEEERKRLHEIIGKDFRSVMERGTRELEPESMAFIPSLEDVCIRKKESPKYKEVTEILNEAGIKSTNAPFELLVRLGIWSEDENILLKEFDISREYPAECLDYLEQFLDEKRELSEITGIGYMDLTELYTVTIDEETTKDFDDAISFEMLENGCRVGVHITDVSAFVLPDSPLDMEARTRGTSVYLPDLKVEMLPRRLSEDLACLSEGKVRPALSFLITLDDSRDVIDYEIKKTLLSVKKRMTYDEVDSLVQNDVMFSRFSQCAMALYEKRLKAGALNLPFPRLIVKLNEENRVTVKKEDPLRMSQILVSEMMILANRVAGEFCHDNNVPSIYRSQESPDEKLPECDNYNAVTLCNLRKFLKRSVTDLKPQRHSGLGVEYYIQVTSPLRRYTDLVMHRQLKHFLETGACCYSESDLAAIIAITEHSTETADILERDRKNYWLLRFLEDLTGSEAEAVVLRVFPDKMIVQLVETLWETDCPKPRSLEIRPGERIIVNIELVWPRESVVRLSYQSILDERAES